MGSSSSRSTTSRSTSSSSRSSSSFNSSIRSSSNSTSDGPAGPIPVQEYYEKNFLPPKTVEHIKKEAENVVFKNTGINSQNHRSSNNARNSLMSNPPRPCVPRDLGDSGVTGSTPRPTYTDVSRGPRTGNKPSDGVTASSREENTSSTPKTTEKVQKEGIEKNYAFKEKAKNLNLQNPDNDQRPSNLLSGSSAENSINVPGINQREELNKNDALTQPSISVPNNILDINGVNAKISLKHEVFLKKLAVCFNSNSKFWRRGFFCSVCELYEVYFNFKKVGHTKHDKTESHKNNVVNKLNISRRYCPHCKAFFFGDIQFWVEHINSELHEFFFANSKKEDKNRKKGQSFIINDSYDSLETLPSLSVFDVLEEQKGNSNRIRIFDLNLKLDIAKQFYEKLLKSDVFSYDFYCHRCEFLTNDSKSWVKHITDEDINHSRDEVKNCSLCHLIMSGSQTLIKFHCSEDEHNQLRELLESNLSNRNNCVGSNQNSPSKNENCDDNKKEKKTHALLLKDLPSNCSRGDVFNCMKDYNKIDKIFMGFSGMSTAKVTFKKSFIARNIVNNKVPITIKGKIVETSLIDY